MESLQRYQTGSGLGCILAHSMGLGKTLQVISFVDVFLRHTSAHCVLIIVPVNTLQNWVVEFDLWLPVTDFCGTVETDRENVRNSRRCRPFALHVLNESMKTNVARAKVVGEFNLFNILNYRMIFKK